MTLVLNDEQRMLRDSTLDFLRAQAPAIQLRRLRDTHDETGFSCDLWRQFADLGFAGVLVPESYGGSGLGVVEAGIIMEAIGRTLAATPFFSSSVVASYLITRYGSETQRQSILPEIAAGTMLLAPALDEQPRHHPERISLRVTPANSSFTLDGSKTFVLDGHVADKLIVSGRLPGTHGKAGVVLCLVPRDAKGVSIQRTVMVDSRNAARIVFDNVEVDSDAVIGIAGSGREALEQTLNVARAVLAAELSGIADEAFTRTLSYLKERRQFGKLIGEYQALQHRAAHLYTEIELTRALVLHAQQQLDTGAADGPAIVSAAKARAGKTATLAVQEGVQMHGGIGMTDELDLGLYMKRVRAAQESMGDTYHHAARWAAMREF